MEKTEQKEIILKVFFSFITGFKLPEIETAPILLFLCSLILGICKTHVTQTQYL